MVQCGAASVRCLLLPSRDGKYWVDMEGPADSGKPSNLGSRLHAQQTTDHSFAQGNARDISEAAVAECSRSLVTSG